MPSALTATTFSEPKTTTWTQLLPSSALSRWVQLVRPPLPMVPPEASTCQIWLTKISSATWTLACRCPVNSSSYTWSLAVGKEVAGATCRKTLRVMISSETRTEWITLGSPLTRGVSFHRTSASLSTRAETCQPLEAPTEAARPLTAILSRRHRGKLELYF